MGRRGRGEKPGVESRLVRLIWRSQEGVCGSRTGVCIEYYGALDAMIPLIQSSLDYTGVIFSFLPNCSSVERLDFWYATHKVVEVPWQSPERDGPD